MEHSAKEADLDTLTALIDEDDLLCDDSLHNSFDTSTLEHGSAVITNDNVTTLNSSLQNCSNAEKKVRILKDISVDIFSQETPTVTIRAKDSIVHAGDSDSCDEELTESGLMIKKRIAIKANYDDLPKPKQLKSWKNVVQQSSVTRLLKADKSKEPLVADCFAGIKIVNLLVPLHVLESRMAGRKLIKMSLIRNFIRGGDIEGDWVTIGVLVNKLPTKTSKNGKTYSIWKMTDLVDPEKVVSIFLFGNVHAEHWKTQIGTVIGILNPSIMPDREGSNFTSLSLRVDHPGKFMMMGTSKDFGHCKSRRKDGGACTSVINKSQCEYCIFHVKKEYKKTSLKRTELQSTYSGKEPNLRNKILKGSAVMYGGQLFSQPAPSRKTASQAHSKDKLTLNNLTLKRKAVAVENEEKAKIQKKISDLYGHDSTGLAKISPQSEFINQQLTIPTAGSRNLIQHFTKEEKKEESKKKDFKSITPRELLKMHEQELKAKKLKHQNLTLAKDGSLCDSTPRLGRGCLPGQNISFDVFAPARYTANDMAKLRAIQKVRKQGPIEAQNPNAIHKKSTDIANKLRQSFENIGEDAKELEIPKQNNVRCSLLGPIDLNSEKVKKYLNRKSNHSHEIEMVEMEKQETYFSRLEKREQMEEKLISTTELPCKVVSCKDCQYTAEVAARRCKDQNHNLRYHVAIKRFFSCADCKGRTTSFNKLPSKSCRLCGGSKFERVGMMRPRSGPKMGGDLLLLRGEELKFLNR